jgi:predicted DNA-binding protein YlxM (UPF0122 family)
MDKEIIKINPEDIEIISPVSIDKNRKNKDIPIQTIIEYRNQGLSYGEIAKLTGCSRQNVQQRLDSVEYNKEDLANYKKHRADMFAFIQSKMLNSIDNEEIKRMPVAQRVLCTGILYDKEEKEGGKIVETVNYGDLRAEYERLRNERESLEKALSQERK